MSPHCENPIPKPPAHIAPYVAILGVDMTVEFLLNFGGAELYLAEDPKGRSRLAALVGVENAKAMAAQSHLMQRRVPLAKPWVSAVLARRGKSTAEIARTLHVSDVSVRNWMNKLGGPIAEKQDRWSSE